MQSLLRLLRNIELAEETKDGEDQRQIYLVQGNMMRVIKIFMLSVLFISPYSSAETDPECLAHLGGAFSGVECYNGLSNALKIENKSIIEKIAQTIPAGNKNMKLLKQYEQSQLASEKFCLLNRESLARWKSEKLLNAPQYFYYDVAYYECLYSNLQYQNKFLKNLLSNTSKP